MKDLIVKVSGNVLKSNLDEFKKSAYREISKIKTDLVTDEDFANAVKCISSCQLAEQRIAQAKQDAMHQSADISALFVAMDVINEEFRQKRLSLNKKVNDEKSARKDKIIQAGIKDTEEMVTDLFFGDIDRSVFLTAVKGKKNLDKMQQAVKEAVQKEVSRIKVLEENYRACEDTIKKAEKDFPGLFPDTDTLARKNAETVDAVISQRISEFKLSQKSNEKTNVKTSPIKTIAPVFECTHSRIFMSPGFDFYCEECGQPFDDTQALSDNYVLVKR